MSWTYANTRAGYDNMWSRIKIKSGQDSTDATRFAKKIIAAEKQYKAVEAATGVPWFWIGAIHMREASNNFKGVLHNGEQIIGTGRKTRMVPKGRGPFKTWADSAIDALKLKNLHKIKEWPVSRMAYEAERYNGFGYTKRGINSPFLWAGSNHEQRGKFIADGKFSKTADDTQIGVMTVLRRLADTRPDIASALNGSIETPQPKEETKPLVQSKTFVAEITGMIATLATFLADLPLEVKWAGVTAIIMLSLFVIYERWKHPDISGVVR